MRLKYKNQSRILFQYVKVLKNKKQILCKNKTESGWNMKYMLTEWILGHEGLWWFAEWTHADLVLGSDLELVFASLVELGDSEGEVGDRAAVDADPASVRPALQLIAGDGGATVTLRNLPVDDAAIAEDVGDFWCDWCTWWICWKEDIICNYSA